MPSSPAIGTILSATAVFLTLVGSTAAQTINPVAPISGGSFSRADAVNNTGTAATGYTDNAASIDTTLRWTNPGGSVSLGLLSGGVFNSYGEAMDSTGTILAGYGDSFGTTRAFRWTTGGGYQVLPYIPAGSGLMQAFGISQSGAIVVGSCNLGGSNRAFLWNSASPATSTNLGTLPLQTSSAALGISGDGSTVVGNSGSRAFRWTSAGGMQDLGSLPLMIWAEGKAANTNGTVITGRYNSGLGEFGYRWTSTGGMVALPNTPAGALALRPRAINGDGSVIVGQVVDNLAGFTGFIWTPSVGSQTIIPHLQARAVNMTGWTITDVTGISPDGRAMCGHGTYLGNPVGWVVKDLPCPAIQPLGALGDNGCVGGSAVIGGSWSMQVGALASVTFRWFKNGVQIFDGLQPSGSTFSGTNTVNLNISNMQPGDAGSYVCAISALGACESFTPAFTFNGPAALALNINPTPISTCAGQNPFLFAVPSAPSIPPSSVTYRWQKLISPPNVYADIFDGPSGNGGTYVGTGTSTFSILNIQPADATRYRCVFGVLGCGPAANIITPNALITVTPDTSILTNPSPTSICQGDNDAFFSVVSSPSGPGVTYQWQKLIAPPNVYANIFDGPTGNGGFFGGTQSANLAIGGVYPGDFTRYRCVVTGPCGLSVTSANALLSPIPEATITSGPNVTTACPGGTASIDVTATPPGSTYQWQRYVGPCINCWQNLANGPTGNGGTFSGATSPTLSINSVTPADTLTSYRCIALGPCAFTPAVSPEVAFALDSNPVIASSPASAQICPNASATLSTTLVPGNYGTVSYQWWRFVPAFPIFAQVSNGTLPSGALVSGANSPTLNISNFKSQDAGQYYCQVIGSCGIANSGVATLTFCPADFNCSGIADIQDIFDFLNAWFAALPSADINVNDSVDIQDIFDFLNFWFAGC
ncbi:MAG: hypothetical protein K2W85_12075 [Phycisphaerales bacterium]|nr:hypothetical protein [Phycisphaerales bacterium]